MLRTATLSAEEALLGSAMTADSSEAMDAAAPAVAAVTLATTTTEAELTARLTAEAATPAAAAKVVVKASLSKVSRVAWIVSVVVTWWTSSWPG